MCDHERAASIIVDADGNIAGRTKLQKTAYLLEAAGLGAGFHFSYKYYGPYSEQLAEAIHAGRLIQEEEVGASWGGTYSIYTAKPGSVEGHTSSEERKQLIDLAKKANPVALELAATAVYFAIQGEANPWQVTKARKPDKASRYLNSAKELYQSMRQIKTPKPLPEFVS